MQNYHLDMEGIPEYINEIKDDQKQSKRSGNTITAATLLLIATNTMPSIERFRCDEKIWEDLDKDRKDWDSWKNLYKSTDQKYRFNKQAVGVQ